MLLDEKEIRERMESPLNLLNRLKTSLSRTSSTPIPAPSIPPSSSDIVEDLEEKIKQGSVKAKATNIMIAAMDELSARLPEVTKPEKLAAIAEQMGRVLTNSQVKIEDNRKQAMFVIYAPQVVKEETFEYVDATGE